MSIMIWTFAALAVGIILGMAIEAQYDVMFNFRHRRK